jgi:hypothetical protein
MPTDSFIDLIIAYTTQTTSGQYKKKYGNLGTFPKGTPLIQNKGTGCSIWETLHKCLILTIMEDRSPLLTKDHKIKLIGSLPFCVGKIQLR